MYYKTVYKYLNISNFLLLAKKNKQILIKLLYSIYSLFASPSFFTKLKIDSYL